MNLQTAVPPKFYGLDHLRTLAISLVFLFHYNILSHGQPEWLPDLIRFGWTGVDLFFVLSGFLISSKLFVSVARGQSIDFKTFFLKRFFRIIPAYMFTLLIYFCFPFFREKESLPPLWRFLTFTQNFGLNLKETGTFSHAWSLCVEEHFYLFLPLILLFLQFRHWMKNSWLLLIVLFLAGFVIRHCAYQYGYWPVSEDESAFVYWYKFIYYPTYNRLDGLLVGVSIAGIYRFLPAVWSRLSARGNLFILAGLGILTAAYFLCEDNRSYAASVFGFPAVAVGYGFVVTGALCQGSFLFKAKSGITSFVAVHSYAIYLTHKGVIHMTQEALADYELSPNIVLLISIITCLLAAIILHRLVERPFMKLRERFVNKQHPALL